VYQTKKDISEDELELFIEQLIKLPDGLMFSCMAVIQFYQALRVSEVAALHWSDVDLNMNEPKQSKINIVRSVKWPRTDKIKQYIENNFKNSEANNGIKALPVFPRSFQAFKELLKWPV
jgi:integrase